jgi:class 3 adenylate cyclase
VPPLETLPLPEDPFVAAAASVLNDAGHWAYVLDAHWRIVFATDELRLSFGDTGAATSVPVGSGWFSADAMQHFARLGTASALSLDAWRQNFREAAPYALGGPGGRDILRRQVDPALLDLVDELHPEELPQMMNGPGEGSMLLGGTRSNASTSWLRIDDDGGHVVGIAILMKPAAGMSELATAAATADLRHLERMRLVQRPDRRPSAILMADLEASTPLARRLSTAQYFAFGRRLVRAADQCIIDEGGIVGRHAGDGVVAFFLAETSGSESAAAKSCITAASALRHVLADVATRSEIRETDVQLRFGLHWGATLYVGRILTAGRSEVTALGDEVNETARIEACATGSRTLASKALIERLDHADAQTLQLDTGRATYVPLADLPTATDKARRDAPAVAVCDLTNLG